MANRSETLGGNIWADGAPNAPASPVTGTTYAKSNISGTEIANGQPYGEAGDSARFNEVLKRVTTLLNLSEQYGILPWCPAIDYPVGAFCTGSDGLIYKSVANPNLNQDPVSSSGFWVDAFRSATETRTGIIELATSAEVIAGTDATRVVTPAGLSSRTATETRTGIIELATSAEVIAGTDTARAVTPATLQSKNAARESSWTNITLLNGHAASVCRYRKINGGKNIQIAIARLVTHTRTAEVAADVPGIASSQDYMQTAVSQSGTLCTISVGGVGTIRSYTTNAGWFDFSIIIPAD